MSSFLENYANIVELLRIAGKIEGRKKLQKMVYILKNLGADFKEDFYFHYYGPYSDVLTIELEELKSINVIKEDVKEHDSYFPTYTYELNIDDIGVKGDLENYKEVIYRLNSENSRFLELVATIMYFKEEKKYEKEDIIRKIKIVKSDKNYTDEEIKRAFDFLETITKD
ncbi:hypothetical protein O163_03615 [Caldanaerobacter subterraneus subsp. yonseiensis KB-1]|uniref:Antitoxin SocA-like Panacea domain-containing protein n=1 Tax=Caldanaerobacter subterraneus subsp. yonseiensis KB-1 TaxID=1388761 RepID=U5CRV4_CALSX|nr:hypothetical protein [Caldanaerobacter subterraneus]ERM92703.1 hypothetical protein O163_03615 [Caldanaerobacter subterraneus subsp. yonseiensis KB-1]